MPMPSAKYGASSRKRSPPPVVDAGGDPGPGFERRLRRYWELREMGSVRHALRHDPAELDDALRKLRAEPVLSPD